MGLDNVLSQILNFYFTLITSVIVAHANLDFVISFIHHKIQLVTAHVTEMILVLMKKIILLVEHSNQSRPASWRNLI